MGRGLFALTLGLISASAFAGSRHLQESTQGKCVSAKMVSGRSFERRQNVASLQVIDTFIGHRHGAFCSVDGWRARLRLNHVAIGYEMMCLYAALVGPQQPLLKPLLEENSSYDSDKHPEAA